MAGESQTFVEVKGLDVEGGFSRDRGETAAGSAVEADVKMKRLAVFASGRGTDFQAIIDAVKSGDLRVELALLMCNNAEAYAIERAKRELIPWVFVDHEGRSREDFEGEVHGHLVRTGIDLIALAGFMRVLTPAFISKWRDRIVNIHPALLPSFPGAHAQRDALEYGVKVSGLTIHFVDEKVDHGPIIFQLPVEVKYEDTEETLSARVLEQEHIWYPRVIQWLAEGRVRREGRRVRVG